MRIMRGWLMGLAIVIALVTILRNDFLAFIYWIGVVCYWFAVDSHHRAS